MRGTLSVLLLLLVAASPPPRQAGARVQDQTNGQIANSLERIAATLQNRTEAPVSNPPCGEGETNRNSDLCAQWRAADAANSSSSASWLFGILGCLIGGATLVAAALAAKFAKLAADHTETGANAAREAVAETKRIGEAQTRCYMSVTGVQIKIEDTRPPQIWVTVKNSGNSPARSLKVKLLLELETIGGGEIRKLARIPWTESISNFEIAAGEERTLPYVAVGGIDPEPSWIIESADRSLIVKVSVVTKWRDVFDNRSHARSTWSAWPATFKNGLAKLVPHAVTAATLEMEMRALEHRIRQGECDS